MSKRCNKRVSKVGWTSQDSAESVHEDVGSDRDPQHKSRQVQHLSDGSQCESSHFFLPIALVLKRRGFFLSIKCFRFHRCLAASASFGAVALADRPLGPPQRCFVVATRSFPFSTLSVNV
jgi:hypothetical protein